MRIAAVEQRLISRSEAAKTGELARNRRSSSGRVAVEQVANRLQ